jgi:hypothetical protein
VCQRSNVNLRTKDAISASLRLKEQKTKKMSLPSAYIYIHTYYVTLVLGRAISSLLSPSLR